MNDLRALCGLRFRPMRLALLLALVLVPSALAGPSTTPGAAAGPIVIGGVAPPGSPFARGAAAYFRYVNGRGGVGGRTVEYRVVDGGADPAAAARGLVLDGALVVLGRDVFVPSGSTSGFLPSWRLQGAVLAGQVLHTSPPGRIAVLAAHDPEGTGILAAFRSALGPRAGDVVSASTLAALPRRAPTLVVLGQTSGREGAVSVAYLKDPGDPRWAGDPAFEQYRRTGGLRTSAEEQGMAAAFALVDALRRSGQSPTRARVLAASHLLAEANNPFLVPGAVIRAGRVQQVVLRRWLAGRWRVVTGPLAR